MPQSPNPPTTSVSPSLTPLAASAALADANTFFDCSEPAAGAAPDAEVDSSWARPSSDEPTAEAEADTAEWLTRVERRACTTRPARWTAAALQRVCT